MADPQELETLVRTEMNRMRGRLAGFIEACGLPGTQERGMVATMKSLSYDAERALIELINQ